MRAGESRGENAWMLREEIWNGVLFLFSITFVTWGLAGSIGSDRHDILFGGKQKENLNE